MRPSYSEGENFSDLLLVLWQKKWSIILCVVLSVSVGIAYLMTVKPTYEAKAYIIPPSAGDITALNYGRIIIKNDSKRQLPLFDVKDIYEVSTRYLVSESTKRNFFSNIYLPSLPKISLIKNSQDALFANFKQQINIHEIPRSLPIKYMITVKNHDPEKAATLLREYISLVKELSTKDMMSIIQKQHLAVSHDYELMIDQAMNIAKKERLDRLVQLKEALSIANAIDLKDPSVSTSGNNMTIELDSLTEPDLMYRRGTKALQSELKNLTLRESDAPFIPNFREMQAGLDIKNVHIDPKDVEVLRIDGAIEVPYSPIAPKKDLVITFSLFIGLVLGVFLVLLRYGFLKAMIRKLNY